MQRAHGIWRRHFANRRVLGVFALIAALLAFVLSTTFALAYSVPYELLLTAYVIVIVFASHYYHELFVIGRQKA